MPNIPLAELVATWEMLVQFKTAIRQNQYWPGDKLEAVAMGLNMIARMESQYRAQVERARMNQKENARKAKDSIAAQGGKINGETANTSAPVTAAS